MSDDPIRKLGLRGYYRGVRAELEEVDRKLAEEYRRPEETEKNQMRVGWWSRQDQTTKVFIGIGGLMLEFFVCLWITNTLRIHQEKKAVQELTREATTGVKEMTEKILAPVR